MRCIGKCFIPSFSKREKSLSQAKCFILKTPVCMHRVRLEAGRDYIQQHNQKLVQTSVLFELSPSLYVQSLCNSELCFPRGLLPLVSLGEWMCMDIANRCLFFLAVGIGIVVWFLSMIRWLENRGNLVIFSRTDIFQYTRCDNCR